MIVATGLLLPANAFAGDYTVSYAFDGTTGDDVAASAMSALNDEGTSKECQYERRCTIELTKSDLTIALNVQRSGRHKVVVFADGGRSRSIGCCYFRAGSSALKATLLSQCFGCASTMGTLAREMKSSKISIWGSCISNFQI
ncbi:hypothetical protein [Bradyrhizobium sp. LB11.1]|uniref:hypothetical protein n=1 Tax=Bradyrhizobium sp. LB11.1 TaxID=3156326 RepID=UPI003391E1B5